MTGCSSLEDWRHAAQMPCMLTSRRQQACLICVLCCRDRITSFHLFIASPAGVVREIYAGLSTSHVAAKLFPGLEYIFSVKACFTDGSFAWSLPQSIRTKS